MPEKTSSELVRELENNVQAIDKVVHSALVRFRSNPSPYPDSPEWRGLIAVTDQALVIHAPQDEEDGYHYVPLHALSECYTLDEGECRMVIQHSGSRTHCVTEVLDGNLEAIEQHASPHFTSLSETIESAQSRRDQDLFERREQLAAHYKMLYESHGYTKEEYEEKMKELREAVDRVTGDA